MLHPAMAGHEDGNRSPLLGLGVVIVGVLLFIALLLLNQRDGALREQATIYTDFRTITGLRRDSPVLLAGVEVGRVKAIDFVERRYECDPLTEDIGRHGSGRTNTCDAALFCAPTGMCAAIESYAAKGMHSPCFATDDCREDEICVTSDFRSKAKDVYWGGPEGLCARYTTEHRRVQVSMTIPEDRLEVIGADSVATVGSAGVLGDQQVNITPGSRRPLGEDHMIQSEPSFSEQIAEFRERFDRLSDKLDSSLSGISSTFAELNDSKTVEGVKQTLAELSATTEDLREGRGTIGSLLSNPEYERDFASALTKARDTASLVDGVVADANTKLRKIDRETEPRVAEMRKKVGNIRSKIAGVDPAGGQTLAKLLRDPTGELLARMQTSLKNVRTSMAIFADAAARIERGEGSMGAFIYDSKVYDALDSRVVELGHDWRLRLVLWLIRRGA